MVNQEDRWISVEEVANHLPRRLRNWWMIKPSLWIGQDATTSRTNELNMQLTVLLYKNGYPPEWDEEVFEQVLEQAENFKKYC